MALNIGRLLPSFLVAVMTLAPAHALAQTGVQQQNEYVPGEVIVKLKSAPNSAGSQQFFQKSAAQKGLQLRRSWSGINMHKFAAQAAGASGAVDVPALAEELRNDPEVEYAEPNFYVKRLSVGEIETLSNAEVEAMSNSAYTVPTFTQTGAAIDVADTWPILSTGHTAPVVAIIDTGIDYNHRVFVQSGAIWTNPYEVAGNGVDDDGNGYVDDVRGWNFASNTNNPMDDNGHGTHVAGIVLGAGFDIKLNPAPTSRVKVMPLKFLDRHGSGTTSDAIEAIYYAANNGAKILNNSWGGGGYSQSLVDAMTYAYNKKVLFVAAAGNVSNNNDASPTYPSSYSFPNLIAVAASNDFDNLAYFSNFGAAKVNLGSPGVSIYSTLPSNSFGLMNGTSMATPFVAGVAALMLYENPAFNGYQLRQLLYNNSELVSGLSGKVSTNARLNSYNSVSSAQVTTASSYMPSYDSSLNINRSVASEGAAPAGCGTVAKMMWDHRDSGSGPSNPMKQGLAVFGLLLILFAPVLLSVYLKSRDPKSRRAYDRYHIASAVTVRAGGRELVGEVSSISMGGALINVDSLLEKGGVVTMQIASPDGKDVINVEGKVVWSEEQKRYGVQFQNAQESVLASISRWTQSLIRN